MERTVPPSEGIASVVCGRLYMLSWIEKSREEAELTCCSLNMTVVSMEDATKSECLANFYKTLSITPTTFWSSGTDGGCPGKWIWCNSGSEFAKGIQWAPETRFTDNCSHDDDIGDTSCNYHFTHDNHNTGSYNYNPGPYNQNPGPYNHIPGPNNHDSGPYNHNPGPYNHNSGPYNHNPGHYNHNPSPYNHDRSSNNHDRASNDNH
ncbi:hypothetical protein B566_EDAN015463 [Ephemera danica]|nr:hypothetical protein B566_EDAN015463 [Ephemera danica]